MSHECLYGQLLGDNRHTLISVLVRRQPFNLGATAQRGDIIKGVCELNKRSKGGVKRLIASNLAVLNA